VLGGSGGGGDLAEVEMVGEHDEVEGGAPSGVRRCSSITTAPLRTWRRSTRAWAVLCPLAGGQLCRTCTW
jgi:hypothetical protein